jgi:hypothetical protein
MNSLEHFYKDLKSILFYNTYNLYENYEIKELKNYITMDYYKENRAEIISLDKIILIIIMFFYNFFVDDYISIICKNYPKKIEKIKTNIIIDEDNVKIEIIYTKWYKKVLKRTKTIFYTKLFNIISFFVFCIFYLLNINSYIVFVLFIIFLFSIFLSFFTLYWFKNSYNKEKNCYYELLKMINDKLY